MARVRTVKPSFFKDAGLYDAEAASGLPLRLAYEGLWCQADRAGRFEWKPRELKLDILPYDDLDFAAVLDALADAGFIVRYEVEGRIYGLIPNLNRHQHFHKNEQASTLPAPCKDGASTVQAPSLHPASTPDTDTDTDTGVDADAGGDGAASAAPSPSDLADWFPPEYHPDLDAALRSTPSPTALVAELRLLRREPQVRGLVSVSGAEVGQALRDAAMKGIPLSGKTLANCIRVTQRSPPVVVGSIEQAVADHDREREARRARYAAGNE